MLHRSVLLKNVTQEALITEILPAIQRTKREREEKDGSNVGQIKFAELLESLGYKPEFNDLNFSLPGVTIEPATPKQSGISIMRGTSLLTHLDYSGIEFRKCNLDYLNLSDSYFNLMGFDDCSMARIAIQNSVLEDVTCTDCRMSRVSFDASSIVGMEMSHCDLTDVIFSYLKKCQMLTILDSDITGISFLGDLTPVNCEIVYFNETTLNNVYLPHQGIKLTHAKIGEQQPRIGMCWSAQSPGYTAELARTSLIANNVHPIHLDYLPPLSSQELKNLEIEVQRAATVVREQVIDNRSTLSFSFAILETAKANPAQFPLIIKLYNYAENALTQMDGFLVPGGADINPLFYNQERHDKTKPMTDLRRDVLEFAIFHAQQSIGTPIYAICRGSQIAALSYGATFYQHVSDNRSFIGEKIKLVDAPRARSSASQMSSLLSSHVGAPVISPVNEENDTDKTLFVHHQGYRMSKEMTEKALFETLATTSVSGETTPYELTVAAESVPRNIFIAQFHPEGGNDKAMVKNIKVSQKLATEFLDGFCARVRDFRDERSQGRLMCIGTKGNYSYMHPKHVSLATSPHHGEKMKASEYDTVIFGLGATGLESALTALARGERVAILTDRLPTTGLSPNEKVESINKEIFDLIKSLVYPAIFNGYVKSGQIVESEYKGKPCYNIVISALEKMLLEQVDKLKKEGAPVTIYQMEQIDQELLNRVKMSCGTERVKSVTGMRVDISTLRDLTTLHKRENVDISHSILTLTGVKKIDGESLIKKDESYQLKFANLIVCDSSEKILEKSMPELSGDNDIIPIHPDIPFHARVIFELKNFTHRQCTQADNDISTRKKPANPVPFVELQKLSWAHLSRPYSQIYSTGNGNNDARDRFYIDCEIPEKLYRLALSSNPLEQTEGKKQIRKFARLLIKDSLPEEICEHSIVDPECKTSDEYQKEQAAYSVSPIAVEFFELNQSCMLTLRADNRPGIVTFLGDGLMSPLYATKIGLQTNTMLVRYFHEAQMGLKRKLANVETKKFTTDKLHQQAVDKVYADVYGEYHARARAELDRVREAQNSWIEKRNQREKKATQFYEIHNLVVKTSDVLKAITAVVTPNSLSNRVSGGGLFSLEVTGVFVHRQLMKLNAELQKYCLNPSEVVSYESLGDLLGKGDPKKYLENLFRICEGIKELGEHFEHRIDDSLINKLNEANKQLETACLAQIGHNSVVLRRIMSHASL